MYTNIRIDKLHVNHQMRDRRIRGRMGVIDENARRRLKAWLAASGLTQDDLAKAIPADQNKRKKKQNYVSRYLDGTIYKIELDTLAAMASVFGRTLCELLDTQPSTSEGELIELFRAMSPEMQAAFLGVARAIDSRQTTVTSLPTARLALGWRSRNRSMINRSARVSRRPVRSMLGFSTGHCMSGDSLIQNKS